MFDQYLGVIKALGFQFVPAEWGSCSGAVISINQYTSLFSLLGCAFGGDCRSTFGLPDLRGRAMMGQGTGPGLTMRMMGQTPGWFQEVFGYAYMPAHSHSFTYSGDPDGGAAMTVSISDKGGKKQTPSDGDYLAVPASSLGTALGNAFTEPSEMTTKVAIAGVTASFSGFDSEALVIEKSPQATSYVQLVQPSLAMNYCICMSGLYPSRS